MPGRRTPLHRTLALLAVVVLLVNALPAPGVARAAPGAQDSPAQRRGRVLLNPGGFLTGPAAGDALDIARAYLDGQRLALGLSPDDLTDVEVTDRYVSSASGLTHLYLRQRLNGIPVFNATINVGVAPDGRILSVGSGFVSDLARSVSAAAPRLTAAQAVGSAASALGMQLSAPVVPLTAARGDTSATELSDGGISRAPIPASLFYVPVAPGETRLSWRLVIDATDRNEWFEAFVDASSGALLEQVSYDAHADEGQGGAHGAPASHAAPAGGALATRPALGVADGSSYKVFPFPTESPFEDGDPYNDERQVLGDPADPVASPFGWHDTNGSPGAEYTITRGNNVHAFQDRDQNDLSAGDEPDGGAGLDFAPALTISASQDPVDFDDAATVNLFYANNYIHDVLFHNGFDEAAGNFQQMNYSGQGAGGDAVSAQAQDGGGVVNANFRTPPDGSPGRMQMYLGATLNSLSLEFTPALPSGTGDVASAVFGPQSFDVTGDVVYANDGSTAGPGTVNDGCSAIQNNVAGKIALIDRGTCTYVTKLANAQAAGAIGVVIANNISGLSAPSMGGSGAITIPALSITQAAGAELKAALSGPVSVRMRRSLSPTRTDGSLDNGVIAHEYAHGLSTRLTGGPATSSCLSNVEQAGEGWSDFLALVLTARPGDTATTRHPIGNYLLNTQGDPAGIRVYPYTTDLAINPQTYASISNTALVATLTTTYAVGTTWTAMLWEVYWNLVDDYGFDPDLIGGDGGNRLALELVIEGMKLQPCNPSLTEARDGIILADQAINGGANVCRIWEGFARRGLGYSADGQDPAVTGDEVEGYDLPPECTLSITPPSQEVCTPSDAVFTVRTGPSLAGPAALSVTASPPGATASLGASTLALSAQTNLTIGGTAGAAVGKTTVTVRGVAGAETFDASATLHIANQVAAAPAPSTPANADNAVGLRPTFTWAAAPQAAGYRLELADNAAFSQPLIDTRVDDTTYTSPLWLRAGRSYFWRLSSINGCGSSAPSAASSFTAAAVTRILLVDDDTNSPANVRASYTNALTALGLPYTVWDTGDGTEEPPAAYLVNFQTIIWAGGQGANSNITTDGEAALSQVMGNGRCLVLSSPDQFARNGVTPFMQTYLGVTAAIDDPGQTSVTGAGLLAARGPYTLAGNLVENFTDAITPDATATPILTGNANGGSTVGVAKQTPTYRTAYLAMSLDGLGATGMRDVLGDLTAWCNIPRADLSVAREGGPEAALLPGQPFSYTLRLRNLGADPAAGATLQLTLPAQVVDVEVSGAGLTVAPGGQAGSYTLGSLAAGADGTVTVAGRVSPSLSVAGAGEIRAEVASATVEADTANDASQGLLTFSVPQLRFSAATAAPDASGRAATLTVQLSPVNPHAPATASYSLVSGATAGVGGGSGTVTVAAGQSAATITLTISEAAALGGSKQVLVGLNGPAGAGLGTPAQTTLTYGSGVRLFLPAVRR